MTQLEGNERPQMDASALRVLQCCICYSLSFQRVQGDARNQLLSYNAALHQSLILVAWPSQLHKPPVDKISSKWKFQLREPASVQQALQSHSCSIQDPERFSQEGAMEGNSVKCSPSICRFFRNRVRYQSVHPTSPSKRMI